MKSEQKWLIAIGVLVIIFIIVFIKRNSIAKSIQDIKSSNPVVQYLQNKVWDYTSEQRINALHPKIQDKVREFINDAEKSGIKLRVTDGYRTFAEQDALYAQGRTAPGNIVTNSTSGFSAHNYGLAVDLVPIVNGSADYENADWDTISSIGKSLGFTWGGDFTTIVDKPHFEMLFGYSLADLKNEYDNGQTTDGFVNIA